MQRARRRGDKWRKRGDESPTPPRHDAQPTQLRDLPSNWAALPPNGGMRTPETQSEGEKDIMIYNEYIMMYNDRRYEGESQRTGKKGIGLLWRTPLAPGILYPLASATRVPCLSP